MTTLDEHDRIGFISKRDIERKLNIQKQKDIKELNTASNEKIDYFEKEFYDKCAEIEDLLNICPSLSKSDIPDKLNLIFQDLLILQKHVAASNLFLRTYDIKRCNQTIQSLTNKAKELEDKLLPKKKFGFKNKTRLTANLENGNSNNRDEPDFSVIPIKISMNNENSTGFSGKLNESLCLQGEEVLKKDVALHNMTNCTVKILGAPSTLLLNDIKNCTILCGPVSTSILASKCEKCTLVIACQQLRLHSSKDVEIYLHVTSRAIMEDCCSISICPYNFEYENIGKHFDQSGLDISINNWKAIDDFNWLKTNQHSPNWKVLEESKRKNNWS